MYSHEKGKPSKRMGRKATGLSPGEGDKAAGLPGGSGTHRIYDPVAPGFDELGIVLFPFTDPSARNYHTRIPESLTSLSTLR
jgi:hypothetical protein